jgi:hypothetical protein
MSFLIANWGYILAVLPSVMATASVIAKITPNETDNKWVAKVQKVIDLLALTTGKTSLKKPLQT